MRGRMFGKVVYLCAILAACSVAQGADPVSVPANDHAPLLTTKPLSAVVITQCSLLIAVYLTMPDGRLLRFTEKSGVALADLLDMAYAATRSENADIPCLESAP